VVTGFLRLALPYQTAVDICGVNPMNHALKFSLPPLGPVAVPVLPAAGRPDNAYPHAVPPLPQSRTFVMAYVVSAITSAGNTRLVSFLALNTVCPDDVFTLATR